MMFTTSTFVLLFSTLLALSFAGTYSLEEQRIYEQFVTEFHECLGPKWSNYTQVTFDVDGGIIIRPREGIAFNLRHKDCRIMKCLSSSKTSQQNLLSVSIEPRYNYIEQYYDHEPDRSCEYGEMCPTDSESEDEDYRENMLGPAGLADMGINDVTINRQIKMDEPFTMGINR